MLNKSLQSGTKKTTDLHQAVPWLVLEIDQVFLGHLDHQKDHQGLQCGLFCKNQKKILDTIQLTVLKTFNTKYFYQNFRDFLTYSTATSYSVHKTTVNGNLMSW